MIPTKIRKWTRASTMAWISLFASVALAGWSCSSPAQDRVADPDEETVEAPVSWIFGTQARSVRAFCEKLPRRANERVSVGVLPLSYVDATRGQKSSGVTEGGVLVAEVVASELSAMMPNNVVRPPFEMATLMADVNLNGVVLDTAEDVRKYAYRMGVDVLVLGRIRKEIVRGTQRRLVGNLIAFDVYEGRQLAQTRWSIPNRLEETREIWTQLEVPSADWPGGDPGDRPKGTLRQELDVVVDILGKRIPRLVDLASLTEGRKIYVAPTDSSTFNHYLAHLNASHKTYIEHRDDRESRAKEQQVPVTQLLDEPVTLDGVEFASMGEARDYLNRQNASFRHSDAVRFCESLSEDLGQALRPGLQPSSVVWDSGFIDFEKESLTRGSLTATGLVRDAKVRALLLESGVDLVIAPILEQVDQNFGLKARIYDLKRPNVVLSTRAGIDRVYSEALATALGIERPKETQKALRPASMKAYETRWARTYDQVKSGLVELKWIGKKPDTVDVVGSSGSGFFVSADGLVMTNDHVIDSKDRVILERIALFSDGTRGTWELVQTDEFWDVAVVRVNRVPSGAHVFEFAPQERARVGSEAATLGFPRGTDSTVMAPGFLSSITEKAFGRPSYMYTCVTRSGNSGGPVVLLDGLVVAVNSASKVGFTSDESGAPVQTELTGFALGAPSHEAARLFSTWR